jgi:very-short-patch-repair endonuclease
MDFDLLRAKLAVPIIALKDSGTHSTLPQICAELGLPLPPPPEDGSKADRMTASYMAVPDHGLVGVAEKYLSIRKPTAPFRNEIQDILWASSESPDVNKRLRREVARAVDPADLYMNADGFDALLDSLFILHEIEWTGLFSASGNTLKKAIERHVHQNNGDWSTELLFEKLGAYEASPRRFALVLEGLASDSVRPDEAAQRQFVGTVNGSLLTGGLWLQESGSRDGYPVFALMQKHNACTGRPKNLIFGSPVKPDLRFSDAINNDIEIVSNPDEVLVYDRAIGPCGLRWSDLQEWWSDSRKISCQEDAKKSLYIRLGQSLPSNSPPQALLFDAYHRGFGQAIPTLPALLPEVWLHWDPRTVRQRGASALPRSRMDFLLLLPHNVRIVIEVDGKQHYSDSSGMASPAAYAKMVEADRDLKLSGYHVFRFGGAELSSENGRRLVMDFFVKLFAKFGVT